MFPAPRGSGGPAEPAPWHKLQGLCIGRVTRVQPAGREGRVFAGKLKASGRVGSSFLQKDDAGKPCNLGITDNLSLQARAREEEPLGFAPCPRGRESSPTAEGGW